MKVFLYLLIILVCIGLWCCYYDFNPAIVQSGRGSGAIVSLYTGTMKTICATDTSIMNKIIEDSINKGMEDSDIILKFTVLENTEKNKKVQLSSVKGSKLIINTEKYSDAEFKEASTITIWVITTEEALYILRQGESVQKGPFRLIMEDIREKMKNNNIKIIYDTGFPALQKS